MLHDMQTGVQGRSFAIVSECHLIHSTKLACPQGSKFLGKLLWNSYFGSSSIRTCFLVLGAPSMKPERGPCKDLLKRTAIHKAPWFLCRFHVFLKESMWLWDDRSVPDLSEHSNLEGQVIRFRDLMHAGQIPAAWIDPMLASTAVSKVPLAGAGPEKATVPNRLVSGPIVGPYSPQTRICPSTVLTRTGHQLRFHGLRNPEALVAKAPLLPAPWGSRRWQGLRYWLEYR